MKIFSVQPSFNGFVKIHKTSDKNFYPIVNTSNILGFDSFESDNGYHNSVSFIDDSGKVRQISNFHSKQDKDELLEEPVGEDFIRIIPKVCLEADKTGEILSIGV